MQPKKNANQISTSSKNETIVLFLTLLITVGLVGTSIWWLTRQSDVKIGNLQSNQSYQPTQSTAETFAQVQSVPKGLFNYGGSTSWAPIRKEVDPVIQSIWPQFQLRYTDPWKDAPSSYTGISMLLRNQLAFAQSSRAASNDEHEYAQKRGFRLKEIPVAIDGFTVIVHPSLNIPGLTVAQFDDIVAGKITNWREVGGPDRKIQLYGKQDRESGDRFKLTRTTTEAVRLVAADPGGIYWASASLVVGQCLVKPLPIGRNSNQLIPPYKLPYVTPDKCPQQRNQVNVDAFRSGAYPLNGGSTTWASIRRDLDPAIQTVWPQFRLRYISSENGKPGSGTGIRMLLDNQLSIAQSSRSLKDTELQQAQQRGFTLKEIPVAIDGIVVAVNPSLNIPGLTIDQLNDIHAGKITNWSQVGGPDLKIKRYALDGDPGVNFEVVSNPTDALRRVAAELGGMSEVSAPLALSQCTVKALPLGRNSDELVLPYKLPLVPLDQCPAKRNQVNTQAIQSGKYPLTRRLTVVLKQNGQIDQQAGEAYANLLLTAQGQELIEKAGFVPIR